MQYLVDSKDKDYNIAASGLRLNFKPGYLVFDDLVVQVIGFRFRGHISHGWITDLAAWLTKARLLTLCQP